jgi:carbon-monoxide dehydrogenase medium subunit
MAPFEYVVAQTFEQAVGLLDPDDPNVRPVGGGTAIMLMMKAGVMRPTKLISLHRIAGKQREIKVNSLGELVIGSLARLTELEHSAVVAKGWPILTRAFRALSNPRVRNVATIGGNLAHGDPHMDLPPVLSVLNARLIATSPRGSREISVDALCTGYYETVLKADELISEIIVPPIGEQLAAYMKVTTRVTHDWPALGIGVSLKTEGETISQIRLIVGAATDRPTRLIHAEEILRGEKISDQLLEKAGIEAAQALEIADDTHGSASYKKHLISVYVGRVIHAAMKVQSGGDDHAEH